MTFCSKFHDCLGDHIEVTHQIEVKDNVKPVVTPFRKVPYLHKPKLEKERSNEWNY